MYPPIDFMEYLLIFFASINKKRINISIKTMERWSPTFQKSIIIDDNNENKDLKKPVKYAKIKNNPLQTNFFNYLKSGQKPFIVVCQKETPTDEGE